MTEIRPLSSKGEKQRKKDLTSPVYSSKLSVVYPDKQGFVIEKEFCDERFGIGGCAGAFCGYRMGP